MYATTCVFLCSTAPAIAWQHTFASGVGLGPVVVDVNTGDLYVGGGDGNVYACAVSNCVTTSITIGGNNSLGSIIDAAIVDTTFQTLFVTTGSLNSSTKPAAVQLKEGLPPTVLSTVSGNSSFWQTVSGALTDEYYNNSFGDTTASGNGLFCLNGTGQGQAFYFNQPFNAKFTTSSITAANESGSTVTITTSAAHGLSLGDYVVIAGVGLSGYNGTFTVASVISTTKFTYTDSTSGLTASSGGTSTRALSILNPPVLSTAGTSHNLPGNPGVGCSPITIFTSGSTERVFVSQNDVPGNNVGCTGAAGTDGCVFSYTIAAGALSNGPVATFSLHGFSSALIVDNTSRSAQAASLYFASESTTGPSTTAPNCTYGSANTRSFCAVKATQSALQ